MRGSRKRKPPSARSTASRVRTARSARITRQRKRRLLARPKPVDAYLARLSPSVQRIARALRKTIVTSFPELQEEIKWKIPFYSHKGLVCYINAVREKVVLGFSYGANFPDQFGVLEGRGRDVRLITFRRPEEIRRDIISHFIMHAIIYNELRSELSFDGNSRGWGSEE